MWILPLVGYLGSVVGFCFMTLAIGRQIPTVHPHASTLQSAMAVLTSASSTTTASGLYYLSELVEEHTVIAKRFLSKLIYSIMVLQLFLCIVDRFPFLPTALGIFSHFIYLGNMRRFPFVKLTDPLFLASCGTCTCVLGLGGC